MSVGDGKVHELKVARGLADAAAEEKVVFRIVIYADGTMDWKTPRTEDPLTNEILARGWLDKVRDTLLAAMSQPPSRIVT